MIARLPISLPLVLALATSVWGAAAPARAQPSAITVKEAFDHLNGLNAELRTTWESLPKSYGADPVKEAAAINEAQKTVDAIIKRVQGKHKKAAEAFKALQQNIAQFNAQLKVARLAQKASAANAVIVEKHAQEMPASDSELALLADSINKLNAAGAEAWLPVTTWFQEQETGHLARKQALIDLAAEREKQAQTAAKQAALEAAMKSANGALAYVQTALGEEGAVSESVFRELQAAANKVTNLDADAGQYWMGRLQALKLAAALKERSKADQGELAAMALEGGLLSSGRVKSKTLKVRFKADADWCYAIAMRHVGGSGVSVSPLSFSFKSREGHLQTFAIPQRVPGFQELVGACADNKGAVTARADVKLSGGSLRWAVVGWPRANVPSQLFSQAQALLLDQCDFESWVSQWRTPVPGTVVVYNGRAHLVADVSDVGNPSLTLINVAGQKVEAAKTGVSDALTTSASVAPPYEFGGCPGKEQASATRSKAINRCYEKIERKFKRSIGKLQKKVDRARSDKKREKAEAKLAEKKAKQAQLEEEKCAPLKAEAAEDGASAYREIVDWTNTNAASTPIQRSVFIKALEKAKPGL